MLVSHKYKFILIKTRKTAGSSLEGLLQPLCVPDGYVPRHAADEIVTSAGIVGTRAGGQRGARGYVAHMPAEAIYRALGRRTFDSYTKIVPVRDPFDKVVSWFWHVMPADTRERVSADFGDARRLFRDWLGMRPNLNVDRQFYKLKKGRFDCILVRYEELEEGVKSLSEQIGVPLDLQSLPKWKTSTRRHRDHATAEYYDKQAANVVRSKFRYDFKHFGYDPDSVAPSSTPQKPAKSFERTARPKR